MSRDGEIVLVQRWRGMTPTERFWVKVQKGDGCWEWIGARHRNGYGQIYMAGRRDMAHRVSWRLHFGPIPEGLFVCHHCDNKSCVRPEHLFVGTSSDNGLDMVAKHGHWTRDSSRITYRGDAHWTRQHPERVLRGVANGSHLHPERLARGERNPNARLTEEAVREIRELYSQGATILGLSKHFGVARPTIKRAATGQGWAHVV